MRYSIIAIAPFVAAAYAQDNSESAAPTVGHIPCPGVPFDAWIN